MTKTTKAPRNTHFTLKCDNHKERYFSDSMRALKACQACCTVVCHTPLDRFHNEKELRTRAWIRWLEFREDHYYQRSITGLPERPRWAADILPAGYTDFTYKQEFDELVNEIHQVLDEFHKQARAKEDLE
jgi:hypothetical protein